MSSDFTPQELKLIHDCNIAQLEYAYDCESCINQQACTDFMVKHQCVPVQAIKNTLSDTYINSTDC